MEFAEALQEVLDAASQPKQYPPGVTPISLSGAAIDMETGTAGRAGCDKHRVGEVAQTKPSRADGAARGGEAEFGTRESPIHRRRFFMAKTETSHPTPDVPARSLPKYEAITALTDAFCKGHLNEEYAQMCRLLAAELARKQPTPLPVAVRKFGHVALSAPSAGRTSWMTPADLPT